MTCRSTRLGSAVTSLVMQETGLDERQVLSMFHELQREGRNAMGGEAHLAAEVAGLRTVVNSSTRISDARRRSLLARLDGAAEQDVDGRTMYASHRLMARAARATNGLDAIYREQARLSGGGYSDVHGRMRNSMRAAFEDRTLRAPAEFADRYRERYPDAPADRITMYAAHVEDERNAARRPATRDTFTDADRIPVTSTAVRTVAYDPTSGRLEVEMVSSPGRFYAYRIPQETYTELMSGSVGSFYARNIRSNPDYQYRTAAESDADGVRTQCATCGQFAAPDHTCPIRGSREEQIVTERAARRAVRASRGITTAPDEEIRQAVTNGQVLPRRVADSSLRNYFSVRGSNHFCSPNLTALAGEARSHGGVTAFISSSITRTRTDEGIEETPRGEVLGDVNVVYNGRGRGYTVTPVTDGNRPLRCNCIDYRTRYDCVHVRQTIADLTARLNADSVRTPHEIVAPAIAEVTADLARDRAESVQAQAAAISNWSEASPVSYTEDMAAFQSDYRAAKARREAGEAVVPYMTENATDGLGSRGTGRAFGVELEFDIAPGHDRDAALAAIGRDLHRAGLTRSSRQAHYHASAGRGYTEDHNGGWSYEADCTVAGELVSPIMYDTPETWENLAKACEIIKRHGGVASVRAGSHVHVGVGNYDHTVENHNRLMGMFHEYQDVMYRVSSNTERGTHRGPQWCAPNHRASNGYRSVSDAQRSNNGHGLGMNLQSVSGRSSDHVEFRTWDSSLDPGTIQTQIKVSLGVAEAAFRDRDYVPGPAEPLGTHRQSRASEHGAARRNLTGEAWEADTASFRRFADTIFRRPADKAQVTSIFAATRWQQNGRAR